MIKTSEYNKANFAAFSKFNRGIQAKIVIEIKEIRAYWKYSNVN